MQIHVIAFPTFFKGEAKAITQIMAQTNVVFHLRKPKAEDCEIEALLLCIPEQYHDRIILHGAYYLSNEYDIYGLHFSTKNRPLAKHYQDQFLISTSCHSLEEAKELEGIFDACFISPIFPSISKSGYYGNLDLNGLQAYLQSNPNIHCIALGGIEYKRMKQLETLGFERAAVLGAVWGKNPQVGDNFVDKIHKIITKEPKPICLSIAGFDPSAGAGVLSDIKAFEAFGCYGMAVNTANTFQNDSDFKGVEWINYKSIILQIEPLKNYPIKAIKIGLIMSFQVLSKLTAYLESNFPGTEIIWDPILKASAGFDFEHHQSIPTEILKRLSLITPNTHEFKQLALDIHTCPCPILLKGGHRKEKRGTDILYLYGQTLEIKGETFKKKYGKHGTGCVLSSAITSNIALGYNLPDACRNGKKYTEQFMQSNTTNLGYHQHPSK